MSASSPERSQSETRIKVMLNAEIVVNTEDGAGMNANQDYINQQLKQAERGLDACSRGFERIKVEGGDIVEILKLDRTIEALKKRH